MTKFDDGGPAFPRTGNFTPDGESQFDSISLDGMALRDWFAGQSLAGLLSLNATYGQRTDNRMALAKDAYAHADAMLTARKKGPSDD